MNIFCNKCFRQKDENLTYKFYVSSCKHVLCAECVQDTCTVCKKQCKWLLICRDMPTTPAMYFSNTKDTFQQFQNAYKFQMEQEATFCKYTLEHLPPALRKLQKDCEGLQKLDARLRNEIEMEKERVEKLKAYLAYSEQRNTQTLSQRPTTPVVPTLSSSDFSRSTSSSSSKKGKPIHDDDMSLDDMDLDRKSKKFFFE